MEHLGVLADENWSSFAAAMPIEEYDMAHLLGSYEFDQDPSYLTSNLDPSLCYWPQGDCSGSNGFGFIGAPPSQYGSCNASDSILVPAIDDFSKPAEFVLAEEQMNTATPSLQVVPSQSIGEDCEGHSMEITEGIVPPIQNSQLKAEFEPSDKDDDASVLSPKKRVRASLQIKRSNKKAKTKREQKSLSTDGEEGQSSSCNSFDDDSNAMGELNSGGCGVSSNSLNLNGKTRASRGTATDPQSLYARKRRERINERLRILQNLVPNGTKVDISTMLEEAVQYVKFLQLQIKLLSSDELWMYAPIAYNGMNIGLDLNISPPKP